MVYFHPSLFLGSSVFHVYYFTLCIGVYLGGTREIRLSRIDTIFTSFVSLGPVGSRGRDGVRSQRVWRGRSVRDRGGQRASDLSKDPHLWEAGGQAKRSLGCHCSLEDSQ